MYYYFIGHEEGKHSVDADDNLFNQVYSRSRVYPEFMLWKGKKSSLYFSWFKVQILIW